MNQCSEFSPAGRCEKFRGHFGWHMWASPTGWRFVWNNQRQHRALTGIR